jgi:hypothetical protein
MKAGEAETAARALRGHSRSVAQARMIKVTRRSKASRWATRAQSCLSSKLVYESGAGDAGGLDDAP